MTSTLPTVVITAGTPELTKYFEQIIAKAIMETTDDRLWLASNSSQNKDGRYKSCCTIAPNQDKIQETSRVAAQGGIYGLE